MRFLGREKTPSTHNSNQIVWLAYKEKSAAFAARCHTRKGSGLAGWQFGSRVPFRGIQSIRVPNWLKPFANPPKNLRTLGAP